MDMIRGKETIAAICSRHSIHPTQANRWKDKALEIMAAGFNNKSSAEQKQKDELIDELYKQIGQLKVELDWLKKNMGAA